MNASTARIHITKPAAAERQLRAALRLYFLQEDDLAIHTIASAAYRLIADLKAERGLDEASDHYLTSVFYVVRDYRRGTLPSHIQANPEMMAWVTEMAGKLPIGPNTDLREVSVHIDMQTARAFWNDQNRAANFLKHADRDGRASLDLETIDNSRLLMQALSSYTDLVKGNLLWPEGLVFWLYSLAEHGDVGAFPEEYRDLGSRLIEVPLERRREFCAAFISDLRARAQDGDAQPINPPDAAR
jgi:hypothetical protein